MFWVFHPFESATCHDVLEIGLSYMRYTELKAATTADKQAVFVLEKVVLLLLVVYSRSPLLCCC